MFRMPVVFMIWFFLMMMFARIDLQFFSLNAVKERIYDSVNKEVVEQKGGNWLREWVVLSLGFFSFLLPMERPILDVPTGTEEEDDLYTFNCCTQPILRCQRTTLHLQQQQQDRSRRTGQTPNSSSVFRQLYISSYIFIIYVCFLIL